MRKLIYLYISIIAFIIALILLLALVNPTQVAEDGRLPKPRPDQISCQPIPAGIQGMAAITNTAGITYFADHGVISSTLSLTRTFRLSLWDADGSGGTVVRIGDVTIPFSTTNNVWSGWVEVHEPYTPTIHVTLPHDHPSTSLCFDRGFQGRTEPTQTPVETAIQPTLTNTPIPTETPYSATPVQTPVTSVIVPTPTITVAPVATSEAWAPTNAEDQDEPTLDNASVHVQAMRSGRPLGNTEYQLLSDNGLIAGRTDADGMVIATSIDSGEWTLAIDCARATVYAGEVQGQVIEQVDMACVVWIVGVRR